MFAGAIEGTITYPTEFVKTQLQIPNNSFKGPIDCVKRTVSEKGILGLYRGLSPLVIGNASKAGVRFLAFDQCQNILINNLGLPKSTSLIAAGLGAGMIEGLLVVTPSGKSYIFIERDDQNQNDS
jgi:solute carrier family 25 citrate transporter 1